MAGHWANAKKTPIPGSDLMFPLKFVVAKKRRISIIKQSESLGGTIVHPSRIVRSHPRLLRRPGGFATNATSRTLARQTCTQRASTRTYSLSLLSMAGHPKWSKVKHIKARVDARKGKMFSRFSQEISISASDGGGDPDLSPTLPRP